MTESGPDADPLAMPMIDIGPHRISRLICGSNPFAAGSHLSVFVDREMRKYYTPERILKTLHRCEQVGINCWQAAGDFHEMYRRFTDEGGRMHYISLATADPGFIGRLADSGCVAIAHHGEVTDTMFKEGRLEEMHDCLKMVRDAGLAVGVSTHMPAVIDAVESKGWDVDFYMSCVYERHRTEAELERLLGQAPIPVGEVYLPNDPPRMFEAMRKTVRPCLAFKILAAGRLSGRKERVERAYRETLEAIKPEDALIVGMYDRYSDQPAENAALVRRLTASEDSR